MPALLLLTDTPHFTIADVNAAYLKLTSKKETDLVGKSVFEVFPDSSEQVTSGPVSNLHKSLLRAFNTGKPDTMATQQYEIPATKSGKPITRYWDCKNIPVPGDEGNITIIIHSVIDVTEKKAQQEKQQKLEQQGLIIQTGLENSKKELKKIMDSSMDVICAVDANGYFTQVSAACETIWGYTSEELIGKPLIDFVYPEDREKTNKTATNVMAGNNMTHFENRYIRKDGSLAPMMWSARWNANDQIRYGVARDATEKLNNEAALIESEKKYRNLFENNPLPMFIWDFEKLKIIDCNEEALLKYGYARDEFLQLTIGDIRPWDDTPLIEEVVKTEELYDKIHKNPWKHKKKNGELMFMDVSEHLIDYNGKKASLVMLNDVTEKLKAEEQKEFEKRDKEALINSTNDAIWSINSDFRLIAANNAFIQNMEALSGIRFTPGDYLLMRDIFPEDYLAFWEDCYKEALLGESFKKEVYTPDLKNGKGSWFDVSFNPIYKGNAVVGMACYSRNITERKLAGERNKFKAELLNTIGQAVIATDMDGIVLFWNKAAEEIYGWTAEETTGKNIADIMPDQDTKKQAGEIMNKLPQGNSWSGEFTLQRKNGQIFPVFVTNSPVYDRNHKLAGIIGVSSDITENKKVEKQIRDSEERYRTLFEQNLAGFYQTTVEGVILNCNDAFATMLKYDSPEELLKRNATELYFSSEERNNFISDAVNKKKLYSNEGVLKCKDGSALYFVENISLRRDAVTGEEFCDGILIDITQRKLAELQLKEINQRYDYVTKATFDAIWDWDLLTQTIYWGEGFHTLFGYRLQEVKSDISSWTDHIHPEDIDRVLKGIYELIHGTQINWIEEYRYLKADQSYAYVTDKGFLIRDEQGKAIRMVGAMQDITDKKALEDLLDKANSLARIGSWEVDLIKSTVYWSGITKEIHEVEPDFTPHLETGIDFYKKGKSRDLISQKIQDAIEKGIPYDVELQIITGKGNEKWIRSIGEAEYINDKCVRVYGSFQDIDIRKRAELAVIEAFEEKNTILESIGDAFFAVDKNWTVTYWNNQAEKILGKLKNEIVGHHLWEVFSSSIDSVSYKKYHQAIENSETVHFEDYFPPLAKWYAVSANPSDNGLSVYFKDITERKLSEIRLSELNENLQKHTKELAVSNEELEQFAYVASHDLQEPLRMVTGFLTLLEKKYGDIIDDQGKKYIAFAVDGAKRMRQIILDLLEFSRVGRMEDKLEDVDLNKLVEEIQILFRKQIEEKNAVIHRSELPVINGYKASLRQVFQNLIGNALKYVRKDSPVQIGIDTKEFKDHWEFSVADNGIGINEEHFNKIFVIFQRLHNKDEFSGTGMGLAVTKKIIENLGGKIWVESEEGKGSTFYFTLLKQH